MTPPIRPALWVYIVVVVVVSASLVLLANSKIPFILALAYLLPLNVAILLFEMMRGESVVLFYSVLIGLTSLFTSAAFLPLLFGSKFRTRKRAVVAQIVVLIVYLVISRIVFDRTGAWSSV